MMIMDSCQKEGQSLSPCSETASEMNNNSCSNCKTTKTPMWRTGPSGPKSLCNACGIRYRKRRSVAAKNGSTVEKDKIERRKNMMEKEGVLKKKKKKQGHRLRQWDEVERAALLLMALSCGAVFA